MTDNSQNLGEDQLQAITGGCHYCKLAEEALQSAKEATNAATAMEAAGKHTQEDIQQKWLSVAAYGLENSQYKNLAEIVHQRKGGEASTSRKRKRDAS